MKLNLIYYKNVLDTAIETFVKLYEDYFTRDRDSYILGLNVSKQHLHADIKTCIHNSIHEIAKDFASPNDVLLVIGSCYPKDNLLLDFKDASYFPKKLSNLISSKPALKWLIAEKDIKMDIDLLNELFIDIFNEKFNAPEPKRSVSSYPKVIYVSHSKLDCYMIFKAIKWAYGNSNCSNIWKEHFKDARQNLIAINDLVSKYTHNKSCLNKSKEFKTYALEVKSYLDEKLSLRI